MIYCLKDYPQDLEPIETIQLTDRDENSWTIKRYEGYGILIHFEGNKSHIPEFFGYDTPESSMCIVNTNFYHQEDESFEEYLRLRNVILNCFTEEVFIIIEDLFQQRFRINPYLIMECETVF